MRFFALFCGLCQGLEIRQGSKEGLLDEAPIAEDFFAAQVNSSNVSVNGSRISRPSDVKELALKTRFTGTEGKKCRGQPYTLDPVAGCNGWKGLSVEACKEKCRTNSVAARCPARFCNAAVFFKNSGFCHLYSGCEGKETDQSALLLYREATALEVRPGLVEEVEEMPNASIYDFGSNFQSFSILASVSNVRNKRMKGFMRGSILSKMHIPEGAIPGNAWKGASGWRLDVSWSRRLRGYVPRLLIITNSGHVFFGVGKRKLTGAQVEIAVSFNAKDFSMMMWINGQKERIAQRGRQYRRSFSGEFSSPVPLMIGGRPDGNSSLPFDGQVFNVVLYSGVLGRVTKDLSGAEAGRLKTTVLGVDRTTVGDKWIQVKSSLLEASENSLNDAITNSSEAVTCKGCSKYTRYRGGTVCSFDKSEDDCAECMPPIQGVFNCQCGPLFRHTCAPCNNLDMCASLANEPPDAPGRHLEGVSFELTCKSAETVQVEVQVIARHRGSDVFYLTVGPCARWRWYLKSGWGTTCAQDPMCSYQEEPRWTEPSDACKLTEGKHYVSIRPSDPGDIKLTRLRLARGQEACKFETLPPVTTTTTTTFTLPTYFQGLCPSEAPALKEFNDCPFRYYVLEVLSTAGNQEAWKIAEVRLYHYNSRGVLKKFPSSEVQADLIEDAAVSAEGCDNTAASGAFDHSIFSGVCSPSPKTKLRLDLGSEVALAKYTLISANGSAAADPKSWRLWGSYDGVTAANMTSVGSAFQLSEVQEVSFPTSRWMCDPPWGIALLNGHHCTTTTTTTMEVKEVATTTSTTKAAILKDRCFYRYYVLQVTQANDVKANSWQLAEVELRQNGKALSLPKSRTTAWFVHGRSARPATVLDDGTEAYNVLDGNLATLAQPDGGFSADYPAMQQAMSRKPLVAQMSSVFDYADAHSCIDDDEYTRCSTAWNEGAGELNPWWQLDLGDRQYVDIVALLSHPDGCEAAWGVDSGDKCDLAGAVVSVGDSPCKGDTCPGEPCGNVKIKGKDNWYYVYCEKKLGRYIHVQQLGQRVLNFREFRLLDEDAVKDMNLPEPEQKPPMDFFDKRSRGGYYDTRCHENLASTIRGSSPEQLGKCAQACLDHSDCGGFADYSGLACVIMTKSKLTLERRCQWTDDDKAVYYDRLEEALFTATTTTTTRVETTVVDNGWEGSANSGTLAAKLILDLGQQNYLTEYALVSGSGPAENHPKKWILKGSNDPVLPIEEWDELSRRDSEEPVFPPGKSGQRKPIRLSISCTM
mmetsp:Transcript_39958/g.95352  ORF Transcript_39958/g.95352 Transcript_39958/m.95352 type:complete len:1262 (-) Transcript_39958:70-3855(-)